VKPSQSLSKLVWGFYGSRRVSKHAGLKPASRVLGAGERHPRFMHNRGCRACTCPIQVRILL
jgi:hypothetical protein